MARLVFVTWRRPLCCLYLLVGLRVDREAASQGACLGGPFRSSCGCVASRVAMSHLISVRWPREVFSVVKLRVRSGESIQEAVRRFRKLCERSGLRKEMRRKAYYEKPSERRRREELKRLRKARQAARV